MRQVSSRVILCLLATCILGPAAHADYRLGQAGNEMMMAVGLLSDARKDTRTSDGAAAMRRLKAARALVDRALLAVERDSTLASVLPQVHAASAALSSPDLEIDHQIETAIAKLATGLRTIIVTKTDTPVAAQILVDLALFLNDGQMFDYEHPILFDARTAAERMGATDAAEIISRAIYKNVSTEIDPETKQRQIETLLVDAMDRLLFPQG